MGFDGADIPAAPGWPNRGATARNWPSIPSVSLAVTARRRFDRRAGPDNVAPYVSRMNLQRVSVEFRVAD